MSGFVISVGSSPSGLERSRASTLSASEDVLLS